MDQNPQRSNLLYDMYTFFRRLRYDVPRSELRFFPKMFNLLKVVSWMILLLFPVSILLTLALSTTNYQGSNQVEELVSQTPIWLVVLLAVVLAPLMEETLFRLPLRYKPVFLGLSAVFGTYYVAQSFLPVNVEPVTALVAGFVLPIIIGVFVFLIIRFTPLRSLIEKVYQRFFPAIFYTFVLLFGFVHFSNYTDRSSIWYIAPLLVLPQIIVGLVLGYVRMRYGFWYSVLGHAIYNGMLVVPASTLLSGVGEGEQASVIVVLLFCGWLLLIFGFGLASLVYEAIRLYLSRRKQSVQAVA
jgi:membrane protease YdiL (CAAX protease family)